MSTVTVIGYVVVNTQTGRAVTAPVREFAKARASWNELREQAAASGKFATYVVEPREMEVDA
jgi:hypothetical protein